MSATITMPGQVLIVSKPLQNYKDLGVAQGFVVNPENKEQYKSAIRWATENSIDKFTGARYDVEPIEWLTENTGFKISLLESAGQSSQGGKLSFWNCLIEKDGRQFVIGIDQEGLISAIKQSHMTLGTFDEPCSLAKNGTTAIIVHNKMKEWSEAQSDMEGTKKKKPKTVKWKKGNSYKTVTMNNLYFCDIYDWFESTVDEEIRPSRNGGGYYKERVDHYHIKLLDSPVRRLIAPSISRNWGIMKYLGDDTKINCKYVAEVYEKVLQSLKTIKSNTSVSDTVPFVSNYFNSVIEKPNPRELGNIHLEHRGDEDKLFDELISGIKEVYSRYRSIYAINIRPEQLLLGLGWTVSPDTKPVFTDEFKNGILNQLGPEHYIDFGDGKERQGRAL